MLKSKVSLIKKIFNSGLIWLNTTYIDSAALFTLDIYIYDFPFLYVRLNSSACI